MLAVFQTSLLYVLFVLTVFAVIRWRRRRANSAPVQNFKPTPWDEFRRRVCQATGAGTVHEAIKRDEVTVLPGGWLEFGDLAYHADESATVADLWQAREDYRWQVWSTLEPPAPPAPVDPWALRETWKPGELHWDDIRVGDVQTHDAFHADDVWREVLAVDGRLIDVCTAVGTRFTLIARPGDVFVPADAA